MDFFMKGTKFTLIFKIITKKNKRVSIMTITNPKKERNQTKEKDIPKSRAEIGLGWVGRHFQPSPYFRVIWFASVDLNDMKISSMSSHGFNMSPDDIARPNRRSDYRMCSSGSKQKWGGHNSDTVDVMAYQTDQLRLIAE